MNRSRFVRLSVLAFGMILLSFVARGVTRLAVDYRTAVAVSAPLFGAAGLLVVALLVRGVLEVTGLAPLDDDAD